MLEIMKISIFEYWVVFSVITSLLKCLFPPGIVWESWLSGRKKIKKVYRNPEFDQKSLI